MPRWDRLELGLTLALPWLVFLFLAAVHAFLQTPRPTHSGASRLVVVGRPLTRRVPVLAENSAKPAAWLEQPTLFDLQCSDAVWLRRLGGGRVRREAISFGLTTLQEEVERLGLDTAGTDLEARVTFPVPEAAGARHLLVAVRPQRLFPLATWEVYAYRLRDGAPQPVLALRNQPEVIRIARAPDGRLALGHEALWRDNLHYVWNGREYAAEPLRSRPAHLLWVFSGAFAALPWWGWLLVAWPALGLQWGCAEALHRIRAASMEASTARAEAVGLLSIGAGLGLTLVAIVALRRYPSWDLVSGLLAPVLVGLALCCGLQWTAATAEKLRPG